MQSHIQDVIQAIRDQLDRADVAPSASQIGHILIAISQLTDVVEALSKKQPAVPEVDPYAVARQSDPYADPRREYASERRIDEWAAYQREQG